MEWLEVDPIPEKCRSCLEEECYNCDTAGERWILSPEDSESVRHKGLLKAMDRLQRKLNAAVKQSP